MDNTLLNNRFRLECEIGRGGTGVVYRAHDCLLDRPVAVKILAEGYDIDQDRDRLLREARAIAKLKHPNIVAVYDACRIGDSLHIIMEYVEGTSLHKQSPRETRAVVAIALQLCAALEHAHAHGIVHRDLKPENVIVARDGTAKLMDFGLARPLLSRVTNEGAIVGTVFYIAPEQALGRPVDGRADLYSLGVILYELTTGRLPFTADDPLAVISQHVHAPVVPPSTYNEQMAPRLEALILALLAKEPADRPATAAEVIQALAPVDQSIEVAGQPIAAIDRLVRGRLVGRSQELAQVRSAWLQVSAGNPKVLLISGEPGIGKTRLVDEVASQVRVTGGMVLAGECRSGGSAPYAAMAQVIEQAAEQLPDGERQLSDLTLAELIRLAPSLQTRYPDVPSNPPLNPQADHQRLCESVFLLMRHLAQRAPVMLLVEDIHWADEGTLSLMNYMTSRGQSSALPLLVILTYRHGDIRGAAALEALLQEFSRSHRASHVHLGRFNREQTRELLGVLLQTEPFADVLDLIYHETDGNPFFIEEVCKNLIEQGRLVHEAGGWRQQGTPGGLKTPEDLCVGIQFRVEKLSSQAQDVLRIAAVIGREFDCDILREVSGLSEELLIDALESAERAQLIEEVREGGDSRRQSCPRFAYVHALVQHAVEETLIGMRRQRLHGQVAQALVRLRGDDLDELAPALAHHYAEAGDWVKAADNWNRAGDYALSLFAYPEAIRAHRQALNVFRERNDLERAARILMKLGLTHQALFEFDEAHRAFQEGSALWQRIPPLAAGQLKAAPHAFRIGWFTVTTLDPSRLGTYMDAAVAAHLFRGLVERTPEMTILPDGACAWETLEGGRRYVFHLREDVHWTDGLPTTAHDFEYAWKRCLDPNSTSTLAHTLYDIRGARAYHTGEVPTPDAVGVRAIDDLTLLVDLDHPVVYFLQLACSLLPVPRHAIEAHGEGWTEATKIVSNGAFLVEEWRPQARLELARNPAFVGRFSGNLQKVDLRMDPGFDHVAYRQCYEQGSIDTYCPRLPVEEDRARYLFPGEYFAFPLARTGFLLLDARHPPFDDLRVRRAFAHAIDRVACANVVMGGYLPPALGGLIPPGLPGHSDDIGIPSDPEEARRLLATAGYPGGEGFPDVRLTILGDWEYKRQTQFMQSQWRTTLGVNVVAETCSGEELQERLRERPSHIVFSGWSADYPDPDDFMRVCLDWHMDTQRHTAFHDLMRDARRTIDQGERVALYQQADRLLVKDAVVIPLLYGRYGFFLKPWVRRYPRSIIWSDFWKDIVMEPH